MIATLSLEWKNLGETLSTCRFAQRVACIANHAIRNEEIDDRTLIIRLKKRISELESEISCLKLPQEDYNTEPAMAGKLTDEDKLYCSKVVHEFLGGRLADPISAGITSPYKFRECFKVLKKMVMKGYFNPQTLSLAHTDGMCGDSPAQPYDENSKHIFKRDDNNNTSDLGDVNTNSNPAKPVQAWIECDVPQHQTLNVTYTVNNGLTNRSSDSRAPPAIGHFPQRSDFRSPKRETYKSPFEKKRDKEINRLSKKLNNMEDVRVSKEQKLADLRYQVALQELETMETGIQAKLDVTLEQVKDQQAYVLQLKHTEATSDLLDQEKLVERQLRKRQNKFERKLEEIRRRKALILAKSSDDENVEPARTSLKPRVEEKYAQCKKRDGSLNTRQVFEMLKTEEKKQSKVQAQIEREHIMTVTRQLEIKEAATRLKLRELKEMFRRSKDDEAAKMACNGYSPAVSNKQPDNPYPRLSPSFDSSTEQVENPGHYSIFNKREFDKPSSSVNEDNHLVTHSGVSPDNDSHSRNYEPTRQPSALNVQSALDAKSSYRFYTKQKSENSLSSRWDSAYSTRPSTAATISRPDTADTFAPYQEECSKQTSSGNCDILVLSHDDPKTCSSDFKTRTQDDYNLQNGSGKKYSAGTVNPSQLVNGMRTEEAFEVPKRTSKTFDGALSSMLDEDDRQLVYDNFSTEYYNQFARPHKNKHKHRTEKKPSKSPSPKDNNLDDATKLMMSWGPESRNSPISDRLARFLNSSEDPNSPEHYPSSRKKAHHKQSKTHDPFQSKLDEFNTSSFSEDVTEVRPKITALADADRERVYMSKAQIEKERVQKIRKARHAAEVIQRAWKKYHTKQ